MIAGGTYAWVTMADQRINRMDSKRLEIRLEGQKNSVIVAPNYKAEKNIAVRNDGTSLALVRVSLHEVALSFKIDLQDQTGNGHLELVKTASVNPIQLTDSKTWLPNETYEKQPSDFLTGKIRTENEKLTWPLDDGGRPLLLQNTIHPQFTTELTKTVLDKKTPYWLFYKDFFYYSEPLKPGEWTISLISHLAVSKQLSNELKGSLYEITANAQAYSASKLAISEAPGFELGKNNPVYEMLKDKVD
ncbi:hypothetical protein RV15_GL001883 [Enterococcus silesiacus]|nr:hypothetical protein RV15_GL001883 [Enterococcus silesiacus]